MKKANSVSGVYEHFPIYRSGLFYPKKKEKKEYMTHKLNPPIPHTLPPKIEVQSIGYKEVQPLFEQKSQYWQYMSLEETYNLFKHIRENSIRGCGTELECLDVFDITGSWKPVIRRSMSIPNFDFTKYCYRVKPVEVWVWQMAKEFPSKQAAETAMGCCNGKAVQIK